MPYKKPKMTPKAASRARAKGHAVARTRTTLRTPGTVVSKGMEPLGMPVRIGVGRLAALAAKTAPGGKYALRKGTSGPRSAGEFKASVKATLKEKKSPTKSKWTASNPETRLIKAYAKAPFEKGRSAKAPSSNADAAAKMRGAMRVKTSPRKRA